MGWAILEYLNIQILNEYWSYDFNFCKAVNAMCIKVNDDVKFKDMFFFFALNMFMF